MQRIDGITAAAALPTPAAVSGTPGFFSGGDPSVPTAPTVIDFDWLNMIQEELVAVILAAGLPLSKVDHTQLLKAIQQITAAGVAFASDADAIAATSAAMALTPHSGGALVANRIAALVGGAPAALATLKALADAIGDDPAFSTTMATALAKLTPLTRKINTYGMLSGGGSLAGDLTIQLIAATAADIIAGSATDHALTPAAFAAAGGSNANGDWSYLPGGRLDQSGKITLGASGGNITSGLITFPVQFQDATTIVVTGAPNQPGSGTYGGISICCADPSTSTCLVTADTGDPTQKFTRVVTYRWRAVGR